MGGFRKDWKENLSLKPEFVNSGNSLALEQNLILSIGMAGMAEREKIRGVSRSNSETFHRNIYLFFWAYSSWLL